MQNILEQGLTGDREASWGTMAVIQVRDDEMGMTIGDSLLFLHGLESNPGSSLQTEEEAGLP